MADKPTKTQQSNMKAEKKPLSLVYETNNLQNFLQQLNHIIIIKIIIAVKS